MPAEAHDSALVCLALDGSELGRLVEELTSRGVSVRMLARGGSMSPWIRDGDVVTVTQRPTRVGDVVGFRREGTGRLTMHRVVRRAPGGWVVRGDRAEREDGVLPRESVLGVVTHLEREGQTRLLPCGRVGIWLAHASRFALETRTWWRSTRK